MRADIKLFHWLPPLLSSTQMFSNEEDKSLDMHSSHEAFQNISKMQECIINEPFFVRNKIVKDKNRHEDDIPCLFCLCCLESNPDYSKKLCCES